MVANFIILILTLTNQFIILYFQWRIYCNIETENKNIRNHNVTISIFDNNDILGRHKNELDNYLDWMNKISKQFSESSI